MVTTEAVGDGALVGAQTTGDNGRELSMQQSACVENKPEPPTACHWSQLSTPQVNPGWQWESLSQSPSPWPQRFVPVQNESWYWLQLPLVTEQYMFCRQSESQTHVLAGALVVVVGFRQ